MNQIILSKNNFFKFGYNERVFSNRQNLQDTFWVSYEKCQRPVGDFKSECLIAAQEIYKTYGDKIRLCLSGGMDSEIMAESFRLAKIPFKAVIMKFYDDLNLHDIQWAIDYCLKHNLEYEFYHLNALDFLNSENFNVISTKTGCVAPGIVFQIKMVLDLTARGYIPIVGAGDCWFKKINEFWYLSHSEVYTSLWRAQLQYQFQAVMRFFQWSAELVYSFLIDPTVLKMCRNEIPNITDHMPIKNEILKKYFSYMERPKYTGVEKLQKISDDIRKELVIKLPTSYQYSYMNYWHALESLRIR
jgi:hypothetical protein